MAVVGRPSFPSAFTLCGIDYLSAVAPRLSLFPPARQYMWEWPTAGDLLQLPILTPGKARWFFSFFSLFSNISRSPEFDYFNVNRV